MLAGIRRVLWTICFALCALVWSDSASWAASAPPSGSLSSSPLGGSSSESSLTALGPLRADPSPSPDPTPDPSPEPSPEPAPESTPESTPEPSPEPSPLALSGSESTPVVVQLETEQMAVVLLGVCLVALLGGALVVATFGNRG